MHLSSYSTDTGLRLRGQSLEIWNLALFFPHEHPFPHSAPCTNNFVNCQFKLCSWITPRSFLCTLKWEIFPWLDCGYEIIFPIIVILPHSDNDKTSHSKLFRKTYLFICKTAFLSKSSIMYYIHIASTHATVPYKIRYYLSYSLLSELFIV